MIVWDNIKPAPPQVRYELGFDRERWLKSFASQLHALRLNLSITVRKTDMDYLDECEGFPFLKDAVKAIRTSLKEHVITITK